MPTDNTAGTHDGAGVPAYRRRRPADAHLQDTIDPGSSMMFVDFDHTLFAGNSTEFFLAACKPSLIVAVIEFVVRGCLPWPLTRLRNWFRIRDYICVLAVILLLPGNIVRWNRVAPKLIKHHISAAVADVLRAAGTQRIVIITFGMSFVVRALLRESPWSSVPLIATPAFSGLSHFTRGKREMAVQYAGDEVVASSTFITDSLDDEDLLAAAKSGVLIEPQGDPVRARERLYLPLRYTAVAKYTRSYVVDQLVLVELLLLMISTSRNLHEFVLGCTFIPPLFLSILCIYEVGYYENDMRAASQEAAPTLKDEAARFRAYPILPGAWIWAITAGALGNVLACSALHTAYASLVYVVPGWIAGLIGLRVVFHIYNKPNLRLRLHLYPVLQLMKFLAVLAVAPPTPLGAVFVLCQVAAMWAIYLTYRHGGRVKDIERELLRVLLIAVGVVLLLSTRAANQSAWQFQLVAVGLWVVARLLKAPLLRRIRPRRTA